MRCEILKTPWKDNFCNFLSNVKKELLISSPFINLEGVKILLNAIKRKNKLKLTFITNLSTQNIVKGITEPEAFLEIYNRYKIFSEIKIFNLGNLHAKLYLVDEEMVIITSANLTTGGLINNFEYGVLIKNSNIISEIKKDMNKYIFLGDEIDKALLEEVNKEYKKNISKSKDKISNSKLNQILRKSKENIEFILLKNKIKNGKTIQ